MCDSAYVVEAKEVCKNREVRKKFTSDLHNGALKVLVAPRVPLRSRGTPADDLSDWHSVVHNSLGGLFYPNDEFQSQSITSTFIDIRAHKMLVNAGISSDVTAGCITLPASICLSCRWEIFPSKNC
uniref:Uncharacterized protein n=1 Tax=Timema cristinae TaxID=61476 RepID=A0A7R9GWZ6_TIMCR|nr:unnamed protein product [Timema cristinae]